MASIKMVSGFFQDKRNPEIMKTEPEASSETIMVTEVHGEKNALETTANIHFDESTLVEIFEEEEEAGTVFDVGPVETAYLFLEITEADIRDIEKPLFLTEEEEDELDLHATNLQWPARVGDLQHLVGPVRAKTRLQLTPLSGGKSIMREQLKALFEKEISDVELGSMAWLLGFWLGDGYRASSLFALNREDVDVNSTLEECGRIWGIELSMKFPEGTKGATGGLYKILPTRRVLTTGNPFWKVVMSLGFRVDKQKNFPLIYAYEENIVRESLIAGLIDSDGYVDKRPYFYASITAIYVPLKDGIVAVCRSLGLNMSASFTLEHITETGFHVQDTFNCIITPGFNFEEFKSLLSRCGCVRKATAKGALLATLSIDAFAPRISSDLRKPLYSFDCSEAEAGECYEIEFENEGTLITENHITLCTQKDSSRVCCSYKNEADAWSPVPWENELTYHSKVKKLCELCYTNLRLSRTMCSNEECRAILPKTERELLLKAAKVEKTRDDGTTVVGFPCVKCDGMMLIDDSREDLYNQHRKPGFCNSCKSTHAMSWYNDNVYKGKSICHNCNKYQYYTQARCQNEARSLIHHSKHLTEIKLNYRRETGKNAGIEAVLKCIKCQGPVAIDKTKTIRDRKVPYKPGACLTCDRKSERKWKRIPWDKVSSQRMCGKCEARYKNFATRCLNTSCLHIHTVKEIAKMEKKGEIKAYLPDGSAVSGHP